MWPLQVSGNLPDTGSKVKSQVYILRIGKNYRITNSSPPLQVLLLLVHSQEQQKREAKGNADEAASELHKIDNIGEDSEKHVILSVSTAKKLKKLVKPTLEGLL